MQCLYLDVVAMGLKVLWQNSKQNKRPVGKNKKLDSLVEHLLFICISLSLTSKRLSQTISASKIIFQTEFILLDLEMKWSYKSLLRNNLWRFETKHLQFSCIMLKLLILLNFFNLTNTANIFERPFQQTYNSAFKNL